MVGKVLSVGVFAKLLYQRWPIDFNVKGGIRGGRENVGTPFLAANGDLMEYDGYQLCGSTKYASNHSIQILRKPTSHHKSKTIPQGKSASTAPGTSSNPNQTATSSASVGFSTPSIPPKTTINTDKAAIDTDKTAIDTNKTDIDTDKIAGPTLDPPSADDVFPGVVDAQPSLNVLPRKAATLPAVPAVRPIV